MAIPLLAAAVGVGVSFPLAVLSRPYLQDETEELNQALDPNGATDSMGGFLDSGMPDMATSEGGLDITGILAPLAVFIALLVFGRTVIQELI